MAKKKANDDLKLAAFPEEITENGVKIYGETSYENQMAVLSHYLHNEGSDESEERKTEIISAVREFLSRKQFLSQRQRREELTMKILEGSRRSPTV